MSHQPRVLGLIIVGLLIFGTFVSASPIAAEEPTELNRDPNTLIVSAYEGIAGIDPPAFPSASGSMIQRAVYETLLTLEPGPEKKFRPVLAESYEVNDDNTVWTFHLREGKLN